MNTSPYAETMVNTMIREEIETDEGDGFPPMRIWDDDGGDDGRCCDWNDNVCLETPEYYTVNLCGDPTCREFHVDYYCKRHYLLRLGMILRALKRCASQYDDYASNADQRRSITLGYITEFGRLRG